MAVYVDALRDHPDRHDLPYQRWCHMRADSMEELYEMADRLGLRREWLHDKPGAPHFDLNVTGRAKAIELGAIELSRREWVARFSKKKRSEA